MTKIANIIIIGVIAAVTKIILNFIKYTIINSVVAALPIQCLAHGIGTY